MEEKILEYKESNKTAHKDFFDRIGRLETKDAVHDIQYDNILKSIDEMKSTQVKELEKLNKKLDEIMAKPAKKWEGIVSSGISAIVGGIIAYILYQLGLKK